MTQEATKLEAPNFEATIDGKKIFTPKQWLERLLQYTKRNYKMDIAELIRGAEMTQSNWATQESQIQDDFVWGIGTEALYRMTRARAEYYKSEPEKSQSKIFFGCSTSIFHRKETNATTAENFPGPNKPKPRHRRISGGD